MHVLTIPKILREKLSDEGAEALAELINEADEGTATKTDIANLHAEMVEKMVEMKAEIIKWMFVFIAGQFFAILGVLFSFFRK